MQYQRNSNGVTQEPATRVSPLLVLLPLLLCSANAVAPAANAPALARTPDVVYLRQAVGYLAGPDCAGRRVGTPGAELAAQYIEGQLEVLGVQPLPGLDGYRQEFPVTR